MSTHLTIAPGGSGTATRPGCDFCAAAPGRWIHDANDVDFIATGPQVPRGSPASAPGCPATIACS